jgi:deoxyxylulose-5-phosphate synthase
MLLSSKKTQSVLKADGTQISELSSAEFRLFDLLQENAGQIVTTDQIAWSVYGEQYLDVIDNLRIEKLISRLRNRVDSKDEEGKWKHIVTKRGSGYVLIQVPGELPERTFVEDPLEVAFLQKFRQLPKEKQSLLAATLKAWIEVGNNGN